MISKADMVAMVYNRLKDRMTREGKWVDIRTEDEGYYTIRMHLKKIPDLITSCMIIQDIVSKDMCEQFSMHFMKKNEFVNGISFYIRMRGEKATLQAIRHFAEHKIHSKRVATPPPEKVKVQRKKRIHDTPDEDPDLSDSSEEEVDLKPRSLDEKQEFKLVKAAESKKTSLSESTCLLQANRRSLSAEAHRKKAQQKRRSRSIPVLVPQKKKKTSLMLVRHDKAKSMHLTFKDGSQRVVKVKNASLTSIPCLRAVRKGKSFALENSRESITGESFRTSRTL